MSQLSTDGVAVTGLRRWILAALALLAVAYIAHVLYARHIATRCLGPLAPTVNDIRRIVDANCQLDRYKKGAEYVKVMARLDQANTLELARDYSKRGPIEYNVTMDFLHSLTPQQVEALKGELRFASLTPKQQDILRHLPGYIQHSGTNPKDSCITLSIWITGAQDPYAPFEWRVKDRNGRTLYYTQSTYFLANAAKNLAVGNTVTESR